MFEPAAPGQARRRWCQEHQRTERRVFACRPPNQVENHRERNRQRAEQKQWCKKTHLEESALMLRVMLTWPTSTGRAGGRIVWRRVSAAYAREENQIARVPVADQ